MHFFLNRLNTFTLKTRTTQLQQYTCVVIENEVFWDETIGFCILISIGSNKLEKQCQNCIRRANYRRYDTIRCKIQYSLFIFCVYLVFIFLTPGLAIWTIPIEKNDQRYSKNNIGYHDRSHYGINCILIAVFLQDYPRIFSTVVARKCLSKCHNFIVSVGKCWAGDFGGITTTLDIYEQWSIKSGLKIHK